MIKMYRKIGGSNGSTLLSLGAGLSQGESGLILFNPEPLTIEITDCPFANLIEGLVTLL